MKKILLSGFLALSLIAFPLLIREAKATVTSATNKVSYVGDNVTTTFPFSYNIYLTSDLAVTVTNTTTNNTSSLALSNDYSVSLNHVAPSPGHITLQPGGTFPAIPYNSTLTIKRNIPLTQLLSFSDNSPTPAATYEQGYDRAIMAAQQAYDYVTQTAGPAGPVGPQGATGTQGPAGPTGSQGPAGPAGNGTGNVIGPATNHDLYVPQWNGTNSKVLLDGIEVGTTASCLVQLDASARLPAVSGANLTSLPTPSSVANVTVGVLGTANGGTNSSAAANAANGVVILNSNVALPAVNGSLLTQVNATKLSGYPPGTGGNNIVQLDQYAKLPAVDGSQLTNINAGGGLKIGSDAYGTTQNVAATEHYNLGKFICPVSCTITAIKLPLSNSGAGVHLQLVIYADSAGSPGARLAYSSPITLTGGSLGDLGVYGTLNTPVSLTAGTFYWLGFTCDGTVTSYSDGVTSDAYKSSGFSYVVPPADPCPAPDATNAKRPSATGW